jgi:thermostable 8-oxoguanine DNA glycosylase
MEDQSASSKSNLSFCILTDSVHMTTHPIMQAESHQNSMQLQKEFLSNFIRYEQQNCMKL